MKIEELQAIQQQEKPPEWATALQTATKPLNWIQEKIDKPWAAFVTDPWTPEIGGTEAMTWWQRQRAEYEAWEAPKGAKFVAEATNPLFLIPWAGVAAGAGKLAGRAGLATAAKVLGTTAKAGNACKAQKYPR